MWERNTILFCSYIHNTFPMFFFSFLKCFRGVILELHCYEIKIIWGHCCFVLLHYIIFLPCWQNVKMSIFPDCFFNFIINFNTRFYNIIYIKDCNIHIKNVHHLELLNQTLRINFTDILNFKQKTENRHILIKCWYLFY